MASKSGYQGDFEFTDSDEIVFIKNTIQRVKQKKLTTTQLIATLKELSSFLKLISQKDERVKSTAKPLCSELASEKYCYHTNKDVRYLTAFNMGQFFRIYSPHSPLETDQISVVFGLFLPFFEVLKSPSSDFRFSYALETLQKMAEVRFCLLLLTLDSMDLLLDLIRTLLRIVNDENYALVQESITEILTCILASYGKIPESLIKAVVHPILEEDQHPAAARLVGIVIDGVKMDRQIHSFCIGVISTWLPSSQGKPEYCQKVITKICKFFPMVASSILLHVKESLHDVNEQKRLKILEVVVKLLGNELQRLRTEEHKLLFHEFLERFVDIKVEIRATTVASVPEILKELNSESMGRELLNECLMRLLDPDERVRCKAIVASVNSLSLKINWVTRQTLVEIFLRLKDRKSVVRRCAVENILKLFHLLNEEWGELKNVMAESMGHLFETIVAFPELRSLFFIITSKSHFFPDQLDPDSNADLLMRMCKAFTPNEQKCFMKTLVIHHTFQLLMIELAHSMTHQDGEKSDQILTHVYNLLQDQEKAKQHFQKLLEINDKNIWKLLSVSCGLVSTERSWQEAKREFLTVFGVRNSTLEFFKMLTSHTSPTLLTHEMLSVLISRNTSETRVLLKKLSKHCGTIFLDLIPDLETRLQSDDPEVVELILLMIRKATQSFSLFSHTNKSFSSLTKIINWIKIEAMDCANTPKSYRHMSFILNQVLPDEEVNGMMKDWTEIISAKMNETQFALEPFSAAAIQLVCTIGQLRPILLRPYSETLSEFVLSAYLQSEVGIPKALISNPSVPENVNLTLFLKCMALKAITKSVILLPRSTPASRTEFQPHSDKIQCIGDRILDLIQSQDFMSPSTDSTFMIPHQVTHFGSSDNYLRTTATEIALKLSRNRKSEISNILFKDIASMVLDQEEPVRLQVVRKISQHVNQLLQRGQIHRAQKYAACLTLSVIDPCDEIKSLAKEFLNSFISVQRRNASIIVQNQSPISVQTALPEFMLSYLVYIIAHDDNFPNSELVASRGCGVFDYFQQMLLFGLEPLIKVEMKVPGENIPLMKKLMESIKLAHDAEDPEFDTRIYATCDIALELLKEICNNGGEHWLKEWNKTFPGVILLPKALYRVEHHPSEPPRSFLPKDFRTISIEFFKKGKKRGRDREQHEGTGSDRRNLEDSTPRVSNTQLSVVKREKSQKQSKTPMTNKTRTRTTKRQRKEPKSKRN